ncbi:hypothetical protein [Thiocystis violascens]|uniref:Uncharacterized protein n=1 Tax=Thiocystis violascens (strain ATCC 17096 / DSM 198 / 6111) TaxID=765911 RepID=I3YGV9_THIV6|nr:hypothetical protein [Thiocystis violascens]AFL76227.1 hypothetical protein Thivi_4424 [Thiocystis violascens DSM 198]
MTDRDPCHACPHLVTRPPLAPWCARNAHYGQVGCVRPARRVAPAPAVRRGRHD